MIKIYFFNGGNNVSVRPRDRSPKKQKNVPRPILLTNLTIEDILKKEVEVLKKYLKEEPKIKIIKDANDNDLGFEMLTVNENWLDIYQLKLFIKVVKDQGSVLIEKFSYSLRPLYEENDFFRFDHDANMDEKFPAQHINADASRYQKGHFTFNEDTDIDLTLISTLGAIRSFLEYHHSNINPVINRGKNYIDIIKQNRY